MFFQRLPEFVANHALLVGLFAAIAIGLISNEIARWTRRYKSLSAASLTQLMNRENALVVDVSSAAEYAAGHVPGARHVAMAQFDPENKELAKVREMPVAVYCQRGTHSSQACERLTKAGFTKVYWLEGGLDTWRSADLPLAKGKD